MGLEEAVAGQVSAELVDAAALVPATADGMEPRRPAFSGPAYSNDNLLTAVGRQRPPWELRVLREALPAN